MNAAVRYLVYLIRLASKREVGASKSGARTTQGSGDLADWWLADWWLADWWLADWWLADWWLMDKGSQGAKQGSLERFTLYTCALHFSIKVDTGGRGRVSVGSAKYADKSKNGTPELTNQPA